MGNGAKKINQKLKEQVEVLPFNDLNNIDLNFDKLVDIAQGKADMEKKRYFDNQFLETEKKIVPINEGNFYFIFR
jgi:hypothetical protein